jgi:hypothetical protein
MTSASGTHTLLHNGRFDGISDSINWSVSYTYRARALDNAATIAITTEASDGGMVYRMKRAVYTTVDSNTMKRFCMFRTACEDVMCEAERGEGH